MKVKSLLATTIIALSFSGSAFAVGAGKTVEFTGSPEGVVIFDGQAHKSAGISCADCHNPAVFPYMRKGGVKITMSDLYAGKYCGKCHDGKKAFKIMDNCVRCHRQPKKSSTTVD